jgi:inhibitor of cysteine peptidase
MSLNILSLVMVLLLVVPQLSSGLDASGPIVGDNAAGLKKFNSVEELKEYLQKNTLAAREIEYDYLPVPAVFNGGIAGSAEKSSAGDSVLGSILPAEYSTTNVQVAGVDEADFVKNDGRYIYVISDNKLVIVDAYPASKARIVSETKVDGTPCNMFLSGDHVVVFTTEYVYRALPVMEGILGDIIGPVEKAIAPPYRDGPVTHALVYSLSNKAKPVLEKDLCVDGSYFNSRMVDGYVYLVTKEQVYYYDDRVTVPAVYDGQSRLLEPDVYYFDNPEYNYVFHTITSFNVKGGSNVRSKTFLMGQTNTMYVSGDNIYISYPVYNYNAVPVRKSLPIIGDGPFEMIEDAFNKLTESEKEGVINDMEGGISYKPTMDTTMTVIHRLAINKGSVDYRSRGQVRGTLLNQFSMDEYGGNLRVATTTNTYGGASYMSNNVYVLDGGMKEIGALEKVAPGEKIYSTRFMGDRLYMVTFKQMDPFFVIDMSSPHRPKVLGELKIPGYSDYLHPYDATHIIGVGKETTQNQWGGATAEGVKIALFDVSDVSDPKLVDRFEIGEAGTDSEALRDHKAFLFDRSKNLLVIPIKEMAYIPVLKAGYGTMEYRYWDGAYVFGISPSKGIEVKGTVEHGDDSGRYYGYDAVRRSLYIGNVLYTISAKKIVMSDLNDLGRPIGEIDLPGQGVVYGPTDRALLIE